MRYEIEELDLGGILDHAIWLFKNHFRLVALIVGVLLIPATLLTSLFLVPAASDFEAVQADEPMAQGLQELAPVFVVSALSAMLFLAFQSLTQGAITHGIAHAYLGKTVTGRECIMVALAKWHRLIAAAIVAGLGMSVGAMFCLLPGIYLFLAWYIIYPVLMFEDQPTLRVFGRSAALMKGQKLKALAIVVVLTIIGLGVRALAVLLPGEYLSSIANYVIQSFLIAFDCIVVTVMYFSSRCATENFDLELLARSAQVVAAPRQAGL